MIIPSNIHFNDSLRLLYEDFIKRNHTKIKGVLILLNITPFKSANKFDDYYEYMVYITKKYNLTPIGFFNETASLKFSPNLKEEVLKFEQEFTKYYKQGIKTIVRPYNWYNYNFHHFKEIRFYIPSDSSLFLLHRTMYEKFFISHLNFLENGIDKSFEKKDLKQSKYKKKLSIAHPDATLSGDLFYKYLKNSDDKFISEIDDIYFGKEFIYDDGMKFVRYGNVMGVNASDEQIEYLFKIQDEFGISISLTLNSLNPPLDLLYDKKVLEKFINFIKSFYDKGLRVCTISNIHLIKTGILQKNFPEMKFKNTVNHNITDTQSFINYATLGYDYIQLDRSLVRNISELKKINKINKKYQKKLYLLASEFCMYSCPFKKEHDLINEQIIDSGFYFTDKYKLSHISCDNWRNSKANKLPRIGVDIFLKDEKITDEYFKYVDILKISGRLVNLDGYKEIDTKIYMSGFDSFEQKIREDRDASKIATVYTKKIQKDTKEEEIFETKQGLELLDILMNCKNQCYDCHKCEEVFGMEKFDSLNDMTGSF